MSDMSPDVPVLFEESENWAPNRSEAVGSNLYVTMAVVSSDLHLKADTWAEFGLIISLS